MNKIQLYGDSIFCIDNFFDLSSEIIERAEKKGWNKSSPSGGGHGRTGKEDPRTNKFCIIYDKNIANSIWNKIKNVLPEDLSFIKKNIYFNSNSLGSEWKPVSIYDKFRIYKYDVGDSFPEHLDYKVRRRIVFDGKEYIQQSFFTLLIYLNDNFTGGETGYWPNHQGIHCRFLRNIEKQSSVKDHQVVVKPKTGKCVVQDQNILHEGLPTTKGIKYILRTDIIHQKEIIRNKKIKVDLNKNIVGKWERIFETSCKNYAD